jgi:hypothetical protein
MKHFHEPESYNIFLASDDEDTKIKNEKFKRLKNYLKYKYRDSYLFRHAEGKADKPIHYICLLTFDNSLNGRLQKSLKQELPVGKASTRWLHGIAESCHVLNVNSWNRNFPKWPVTHLAGNA